MKRTHLLAAGLITAAAGFSAVDAKADELTLCWAAWDPANALIELSKDFEQESGHSMSFGRISPTAC